MELDTVDANLAPYNDSHFVNRFNGATRQKEVIMSTVKSKSNRKNRTGKGKKAKQRRHNSGHGVVCDLLVAVGFATIMRENKGKMSKRIEKAFESEKKRGDNGSLKLSAHTVYVYDLVNANLDKLKDMLGINQYED